MTTHTDTTPLGTTTTTWPTRVACLGSAALAAAIFPIIGNTLRPVEGVPATELFAEAANRLLLAGILAAYAAAGLFLAAARLRQQLPGLAGAVAGAAGAAVALMLAVYTASFAAGAIVTQMLDDPGSGVGEAALVLVNATDLARSAPSLALLLAAWAARRHLPRPVSVAAVILAAMFVLPITAWLAAIVTPVWLGVAGAFARAREAQATQTAPQTLPVTR